MKPSIGRIVHVLVAPEWNDGSHVAAAIVTNVRENDHINCTIFLDNFAQPSRYYDVPVVETYADAREYLDNAGGDYAVGVAFWPPRV